MRIAVAALMFAAALGGCQTKPVGDGGTPPEVSSQRNIVNAVSYGCEDGTTFTAVFFVGDTAELRFPDGSAAVLKAGPVGSGFHYLNAQHDLRGKGEEAIYAFANRTPTKCNLAK